MFRRGEQKDTTIGQCRKATAMSRRKQMQGIVGNITLVNVQRSAIGFEQPLSMLNHRK